MLTITQFNIRRSGTGMRVSGVFHRGTDKPRHDKMSNVTEIIHRNGELIAMRGAEGVAVLKLS